MAGGSGGGSSANSNGARRQHITGAGDCSPRCPHPTRALWETGIRKSSTGKRRNVARTLDRLSAPVAGQSRRCRLRRSVAAAVPGPSVTSAVADRTAAATRASVPPRAYDGCTQSHGLSRVRPRSAATAYATASIVDEDILLIVKQRLDDLFGYAASWTKTKGILGDANRARQSAIIAGNRHAYDSGVAQFASPWYHATPLRRVLRRTLPSSLRQHARSKHGAGRDGGLLGDSTPSCSKDVPRVERGRRRGGAPPRVNTRPKPRTRRTRVSPALSSGPPAEDPFDENGSMACPPHAAVINPTGSPTSRRWILTCPTAREPARQGRELQPGALNRRTPQSGSGVSSATACTLVRRRVPTRDETQVCRLPEPHRHARTSAADALGAVENDAASPLRDRRRLHRDVDAG